MKDNSGIILDIETGGLDFHECAVTEIGAVAFEEFGGTLAEVASLRIWVHPPMHLTIEPDAAAVQGKRVSELRERDGAEEEDAICELRDFIERYTPCLPNHKVLHRLYAHNAGFDIAFLREMCFRVGIELLFFRDDANISCTLRLFQQQHMAGLWPDMQSVAVGGSLGKLCAAWGIERKEPHDALSDCRATLQVLDRLQKRMRGENVPAAP